MLRKVTGVLATSLMISTLFAGASATAQADTAMGAAMEAARRVNIAGRQRMLSQRISRFSCYIYAGINPEEHMASLKSTAELYETSELALRHGSTELQLSPEGNFMVLQDLSAVNDLWKTFIAPINNSLQTNAVSADDLQLIDESGLRLLEGGDNLVRRISKIYGELLPEVPIIMGVTMDIAGRQRMLTQKAAKEACLIEAGINVEENKKKLEESARIFTATLDALINGFPGMVLPAPTAEIKAGLEGLKAQWAGAHDVFVLLAGGQSITNEQRDIIDTDIEDILNEMHRIVGLYEQATGLSMAGGGGN